MITEQQERNKRKDTNRKIQFYDMISLKCDQVHYDDFELDRDEDKQPTDKELLVLGRVVASTLGYI